MTVLCAILLGLAIAMAQVLHGGLLVPALVIPSHILLIAAATIAFFVVLRNPSPPSAVVLLGTVIFVGYLSWRCVHAPDPYLGRIEFGQALAVGLAFVVGCCGLAGHRGRLMFIGLIGAMAFGQAIIGFIQFAQGTGFSPLGWFSLDLQGIYETKFLTRARGFFLNPNQFAWLQGWATLFAVSIACWGRVNVMTRVVLTYFALVFITADMLSGSRSGIASLLGGLIVFVIASLLGVGTTKRRGRGLMLLGALALFVVCGGVGYAVYSSNYVVEGRFYSLKGDEFRALLTEQAWRQFQVAPLVGLGPGTFIYAARLYRYGDLPYDTTFAHDDWLQTLVEYGFLGFAQALLLLVIVLVAGLKRFFLIVKESAASEILPLSNRAAISLASVCATVTFSIHCITDFNLHVPANAMLAAATLGLLAGTGPRAAFVSRKLQAGVLRAFCALAILVLGAAMTMFVWKYSAADYQNLLACNSIARADIRQALIETEAGLKHQPNDVGLLSTRGKAFYEYESALQLNAGENEAAELPPKERERLYRSASEAYAKAVTWQSMERLNHIGLAKSLIEIGENKQAESQYIEAIRLDPWHAFAYSRYADFLYEKENFPRALKIYSLATLLPDGGYAAGRLEDLREEMSPPPEDESADQAPVDSTADELPPGDEEKDDE